MKTLFRYSHASSIGHPLADAKGKIKVHRLVLFNKIGPGKHPCHWCGEIVAWTNAGPIRGALVVDHVNNDGFDNSEENLVPSCSGCNTRRTRGDKLGKEESVIIDSGRPRRAVESTCAMCGNPYLTRMSATGILFTKACSRKCGKALGGINRTGKPRIDSIRKMATALLVA